MWKNNMGKDTSSVADHNGLMLDIVDAVIVVWLCFQTKKTSKCLKIR